MSKLKAVLTDSQRRGLMAHYPENKELVDEVFQAYAGRPLDPVLQTELALRAAKENGTHPLDEARKVHEL